ncbi:hypothetical protein Pcinc_020253 [Petrolisthes cinctipes]|uniref:Uncharacterized protein n=1 Tax=Petrolisthes cinctipes TaxID=88211 RepID=A0AAE1FN55_PETCI|nr:hypothetical protein Pcinc_020253 [Petrolisthes cinctipes]
METASKELCQKCRCHIFNDSSHSSQVVTFTPFHKSFLFSASTTLSPSVTLSLFSLPPLLPYILSSPLPFSPSPPSLPSSASLRLFFAPPLPSSTSLASPSFLPFPPMFKVTPLPFSRSLHCLLASPLPSLLTIPSFLSPTWTSLYHHTLTSSLTTSLPFSPILPLLLFSFCTCISILFSCLVFPLSSPPLPSSRTPFSFHL